MQINPALQLVKEVKATNDIKEVAQMLSTHRWIAISATSNEPHEFVLGRII